MVLDFGLVAQIGRERALPSLKAIERDVFRRMPHIKRQTLATALARAGLRRPRSGKRARPPIIVRHDFATLPCSEKFLPFSFRRAY